MLSRACDVRLPLLWEDEFDFFSFTQARMLSRACDVRLPLLWEDEDFETMANVIVESLETVLC
jgi:hypothetical protein